MQIGAVPLAANVADRGDVDHVVASVLDRIVRIDVVVNNAGVLRDRRVWKLTTDDWDTVLAVHLTGPFTFTQACVPALRAQRYGRMVNVTLYTGLHGNIGQANYAAATAAMIGLTKAVAKELAAFGVTVNVISPNAETRMIASVPDDVRTRTEQSIPMGRFGEPAEMASRSRSWRRKTPATSWALCCLSTAGWRCEMWTFSGIEELDAVVGTHLGYSDWFTVTQQQSDAFADVTADHQWIHVHAEMAADGPFGATVAHGYLTLSLVLALCWQVYRVDGVSMGVNYGANRLRFPAPVVVDSRIRAGVQIVSVAEGRSGYQVVALVTVDIEGGSKPACVVETVSLLVP